MTTHSDDSSNMDQTATVEAAEAVTESTRGAKGKRSARSNTAAAAKAAEVAAAGLAATPSPVAPVTKELPATALETVHEDLAPTIVRYGPPVAEEDEGATREVAAVSPASAPVADDDLEATMMRPQQAVHDDALDEPMTEPAPPRPRYNTLAGAFNRSRASASDPSAATDRLVTPSEPIAPLAQTITRAAAPMHADAEEDFVDEVDETEDEWAAADQPTIQWTSEQIQQMQRVKPDFLQTGEHASWPPQTGPVAAPESDLSHHDWRVGLPPRPRPPFPMSGSQRPQSDEPRLASPTGRLAPPPASASTAGAQPDPRMERFQELRRQRFAHDDGERTEADPAPMADAVRQWWADLRPALQKGLLAQREARASGMHPIPAYESAVSSRLGDAFGRLAASARDLTERAQQAAAPTIKLLHDHMEQAAQGIISRFEGDPVRQQAPLLGPGRIAIFFRQGVSVGQAQRLLAASAARPMRLIPRKHGFLARVQPGKEAEVCERLRMHPYVSDVVYLEFNELGEPVGGRR